MRCPALAPGPAQAGRRGPRGVGGASRPRLRGARRCPAAGLPGARRRPRCHDLPPDPAGRTALGALRAHAEAETLAPGWERTPLQALARLHVAAAAGLVPDAALGRPRDRSEVPGDGADLLTPSGLPLPVVPAAEVPARLAALAALVAAPPDVPALVVAALAPRSSRRCGRSSPATGWWARALGRALVVGRGLDPTGVAVWESALLAAGPPYPLTLARYGGGDADGVRAWLLMFAQAVVDGAAEGRRVADAVLAGRLDDPA